MTAASLDPGPSLFSFLSDDKNVRTHRRETFAFSLLVQAAILVVVALLSTRIFVTPTDLHYPFSKLADLPLIFSGSNGGGGGNHDPLPATHGNMPRASLDTQIVPPTVIVPKEMPHLPVDQTVVVAPDIKFPQGGQIGDPASQFSKWLSDGPGGPGGIGNGCCDGIGNSSGPHVGNGPPGIFPAGKGGVSVPEVIFNPEPSFSEEARKAKYQGVVMLYVVVGKDGHTYDIRVAQSLGMGLDEKAIEAVTRWRFRPGMLGGQPVATQIAVQVDFHMY
jgi:TonB family protein